MTDELRPLVREAGLEDRNFIVSSWVREMRHSAWTRHVPTGVYMPGQHDLVHRLLSDGTARAHVACDSRNEAHLYGCLVFSAPADRRPILHWIYVKGSYRGVGLGRMLLRAFRTALADDGPIVCTQASSVFENRSLVERHRLLYDPYLLLGIPLPEDLERNVAWAPLPL